MNHPLPNTNVQKAVMFFQQAGLSRLLEKLREKYVELGQVGGQVVLEDSTTGERREIASFLGKPPYRDANIRVRLVDVDKALQKSGFACTLTEVLTAFFPDAPLVTRPQQRTAKAMRQANFRMKLFDIATALPDQSRGRLWLLQGMHGQDWLFSRYKNAPLDEQERQLAQVHYIANVLNQLPGTDKPERLALFAQRTSGDPHALDPNRPAGRLLLLALNDGAKETDHHALSTSSDALSSLSPVSPQDRAHELQLYNEVGLLVDTISSNVAVFNLAAAFFPDGSPDTLVQAACGRVLLLPLRQLLEWQRVLPATKASPGKAPTTDIYVFENTQVFEEVIAGSGEHQNMPTLVCTAGWPSMAALKLLDLLLVQSPQTSIHYSGDFDLKGLQIAASLLARYPGHCQPWHFDPDSYSVALQAGGIAARTAELALLQSLPDVFTPLAMLMLERKQWAYQEGIAPLLFADVQGA
ncbi:MAG TPA: TIGR02679 family protein [Ktedonobacteraceae bacterium]|nr:TIGR02679 family protein [Ktedonobacteraceae bacterium]